MIHNPGCVYTSSVPWDTAGGIGKLQKFDKLHILPSIYYPESSVWVIVKSLTLEKVAAVSVWPENSNTQNNTTALNIRFLEFSNSSRTFSRANKQKTNMEMKNRMLS